MSLLQQELWNREFAEAKEAVFDFAEKLKDRINVAKLILKSTTEELNTLDKLMRELDYAVEDQSIDELRKSMENIVDFFDKQDEKNKAGMEMFMKFTTKLADELKEKIKKDAPAKKDAPKKESK
jgi:hypothetical protein